MADEEILYRFRQELIVSSQDGAFVIKDPVSRSFVKLGAAEMVVAQYFDGASTLEQIQTRLEREREVIAPFDTLVKFRERLHKMQIILAPGEEVKPPDNDLGMTRGPLGKLFLIQLPLEFNPDLLLTKLFRSLRFVFTRGFVALTALLFVAALIIWVREWDALWQQIRGLASPLGVVFLLVGFVISVAVHEMAHGLATKAFGGEVPRMGVVLYYFIPAFYTDISDAWLFPRKSERALVVLAGPYSTLILCCLATLIWPLVPSGTTASMAVCAFIVLNLVGATRTMMPFFKGDGYLLLSNALDLPNLRDKSFDYLSARFKRTVGLSYDLPPETTPREARIYIAYGISTTLFLGGLLVLAVYLAMRWILG
ncbi:site-2 protease family protein [Haliangium ochraceum]|uniref:Peptidase M50 n=1 Tax=Haliangium ochraceum (strain DSM 14365 / JCM 11303 / SMP-2) TaxID=502025 RepID=D0LMD0_HALO1|nr:site-2 protease family protein [Haliangium ochraceum]ACY16836.1 peptidase M50 [Haliangium ochraceum DSM 14365]